MLENATPVPNPVKRIYTGLFFARLENVQGHYDNKAHSKADALFSRSEEECRKVYLYAND